MDNGTPRRGSRRAVFSVAIAMYSLVSVWSLINFAFPNTGLQGFHNSTYNSAYSSNYNLTYVRTSDVNIMLKGAIPELEVSLKCFGSFKEVV